MNRTVSVIKDGDVIGRATVFNPTTGELAETISELLAAVRTHTSGSIWPITIKIS